MVKKFGRGRCYSSNGKEEKLKAAKLILKFHQAHDKSQDTFSS